MGKRVGGLVSRLDFRGFESSISSCLVDGMSVAEMAGILEVSIVGCEAGDATDVTLSICSSSKESSSNPP